MIKIGIICPVKHLNDFATQSNFHLILPHLYEKFPEYKEFYKDRISKGDFVVQDNSFFELNKSIYGGDLLAYGEVLNVSEITIPEVLHDRDACRKEREEFLELYHKIGSKKPLLAVAQGKNSRDLIDDILELQTYSEISTVGVPFALDWEDVSISKGIPSLTLRRVLNRWYVIDMITTICKATSLKLKPMHLMGLADGVELSRYSTDSERYYFIRSNDSSSAYVHGVNGILYENRGLPTEKISQKLDFGSSINDQAQLIGGDIFLDKIERMLHSYVNYNINYLKKFAGQPYEQDQTISNIRFDSASIRSGDSIL